MSDWSSDVCSSDLSNYRRVESSTCHLPSCIAAPTWHYRWWFNHGGTPRNSIRLQGTDFRRPSHMDAAKPFDRKSVVSGKSGSVRVDLGGRRIIKKKT